MMGDDEGYSKDCLSGGFVPTWEGTPCIKRFELCTGHNLLVTVYVGVGASVKTSHLVVKEANVVDGESERRRGGDWGREYERYSRGFLIVVDLLCIDSRDPINVIHHIRS